MIRQRRSLRKSTYDGIFMHQRSHRISKFRTWPNAIGPDLVGLAVVVDIIHWIVGPTTKYRNLNSGALSSIFEQSRSMFSQWEIEGVNEHISHTQNHHNWQKNTLDTYGKMSCIITADRIKTIRDKRRKTIFPRFSPTKHSPTRFHQMTIQYPMVGRLER